MGRPARFTLKASRDLPVPSHPCRRSSEDLLPDAKRREYPFEHVVRCHRSDQLIERADACPKVRGRSNRVHSLRPRSLKRLHLAQRPFQRHPMPRAGHNRLHVAKAEQLAERDLGEAFA